MKYFLQIKENSLIKYVKEVSDDIYGYTDYKQLAIEFSDINSAYRVISKLKRICSRASYRCVDGTNTPCSPWV